MAGLEFSLAQVNLKLSTLLSQMFECDYKAGAILLDFCFIMAQQPPEQKQSDGCLFVCYINKELVPGCVLLFRTTGLRVI